MFLQSYWHHQLCFVGLLCFRVIILLLLQRSRRSTTAIAVYLILQVIPQKRSIQVENENLSFSQIFFQGGLLPIWSICGVLNVYMKKNHSRPDFYMNMLYHTQKFVLHRAFCFTRKSRNYRISLECRLSSTENH